MTDEQIARLQPRTPPIDIGWELYVRIYQDWAPSYWAKLTDEQRDNWRELAQEFLDAVGAVRVPALEEEGRR